MDLVLIMIYTKHQVFFTPLLLGEKSQHFTSSKPEYYKTTLQALSSASFEFQFLSSKGRFKPLPGRWLNDSVPVHVQVEVKVMPNPGTDKVVNLFVTSADSESLKLFPENNPYNFTVVRRLLFPERERWF